MGEVHLREGRAEQLAVVQEWNPRSAKYKPLAVAKIDVIGNELAAEFAAHRLAKGRQISTANSSLRVLRSALRLAKQWGVLDAAPVISLLPGENHRERVVNDDEEEKYFDAAPEPLKSIAMVLV